MSFSLSFCPFDSIGHRTLRFCPFDSTRSWNEDGFLSDGQARNWEIPLEEIVFGKALGKGAGGTVFAALYNSTDVAVKQLKVSVFDQDNETFLEAKNEYQVTKMHPRGMSHASSRGI
jgi:hypothetical protein